MNLVVEDLESVIESNGSEFRTSFLKHLSFNTNQNFDNLNDFLDFAESSFLQNKEQILNSLSIAELMHKNDLYKKEIQKRMDFVPYLSAITEWNKPFSFLHAMSLNKYKILKLDASILNHTFSEQVIMIKDIISKNYRNHYCSKSNYDSMGRILEFRYYFCYDYYINIFYDGFDPENFEDSFG
ncbi:hypothetical protein MASR1M45_02060 [Candidatus Kapaibacterium sp.]